MSFHSTESNISLLNVATGAHSPPPTPSDTPTPPHLATSGEQVGSIAQLTLRYGDVITLYAEVSEGSVGFLCADGIADRSCGTIEVPHGQSPKNFKECLFVVQYANQYVAWRAFHKALLESRLKEFDYRKHRILLDSQQQQQRVTVDSKQQRVTVDSKQQQQQQGVTLKSQQQQGVALESQQQQQQQHVFANFERLKALQMKMESESKNNRLEGDRMQGKEVLYGSTVQLVHMKSQHFLTVARESAELEKDCMRLTLDALGGNGSYFTLLSFFRFKKEGEKVHLGDQIRLWNRKFNLYLHHSQNHRYQNDPLERREVNMTTSLHCTKWRMNLFCPHLQIKDSKNYLKAGDIVRIYHKELEGYLSIVSDAKHKEFELLNSLTNSSRMRRKSNTTQRFTKSGLTVNICATTTGDMEDVKRDTGNIWEIEFDNRSVGGILVWNGQYRLRNVATGHYLSILPQEDEEKIEAIEDTEECPEEDEEIRNYDNNETATADPSTSTADPQQKQTSNDKEQKIRVALTYLKSRKSSANRVNGTPDEALSTALEKEIEHDDREEEDVEPIPLRNRAPTVPRINILKENSRWGSLRNNILNEQPTQTLDIQLTDIEGPESTFSFYQPGFSSRNYITKESYSLIYHKHSKMWLQSSSISHLHTGIHTKHSGIILSPNPSENDVFSIIPVSRSEVEDLYYVQSVLPVLKNFLFRLTHGRPIKPVDLLSTLKALTQLILFCTQSNDQDPFKREGIPYENRQRVLRERKVLDMIVYVIYLPFRQEYLDLNDILKSEYKYYLRLIRFGYRLIKQICKNNARNGVYMIKYLHILMSHIDCNVGVEDALLEIFTNNYNLLDAITEKQLQEFINLLKKQDKSFTNVNSRYLEFLSVLCGYDAKPVTKNQEFIANSLIGASSQFINYLIIPYEDEGKMMFKVGDQLWDLANFIQQKSLREYFQKTIELLASLCLGRNIVSIELVSKLISHNMVLHFIMDENLTYELRSSFCILYLHAYIDVEPYTRADIILYTRKWADIMSKTNPHIQFKKLQAFIDQHFENNQLIDMANTQRNRFLLVLVRLCRQLFEFNIYEDVPNILKTLNYLIVILNGKNDRMDKQEMPEFVRFADMESNHIVNNIRVEICKILLLVLDIRTNKRISKILIEYKRLYDRKHENDTISSKVLLGDRDRSVLIQLFKDFNTGTEDAFTNLDETLLDLTKYRHFALSTIALDVLMRLHLQKEELAAALQKVELLATQDMVSSYDLVNQWSVRLSALLRGRFQENEKTEAISIIEQMLELVKHNTSRNQRLLRNINAHNVALAALQTSYKKDLQYHIHFACIELLTEFVRGNPENQRIMFPFLEYFIGLNTGINQLDTTMLIYEIVRNNRSLCSSIDERLVRSYIDIIAEKRLARFIHFLRALVMADGRPIVRNQTLVTKELLDRQKDVLVLFTGEQGMKERNKLLRNRAHEHPDNIINYHINLLYLLCDCAEGKNHVTEVKLQSLLTVEQLVDSLTNPLTIGALRNPLMKFLEEVYINTEKHSFQLKEYERLYGLFMRFNFELANFLGDSVEIAMVRQMTMKAYGAIHSDDIFSHQLLQQGMPTSPNASPNSNVPTSANSKGLKELQSPNTQQRRGSNSGAGNRHSNALLSVLGLYSGDEEHIIEVDERYIFGLLIPFLQSFFRKDFPIEALTPELIRDIIDRINKVYLKTANPVYRTIIKRCITVVVEKKVHSKFKEYEFKSIESFHKSLQKVGRVPMSWVSSAISLGQKEEVLYREFARFTADIAKTIIEMSDFGQLATVYTRKEINTNIRIQTLIRNLNVIKDRGLSKQTIEILLQALQTINQIIGKNESYCDQLIECGALSLVVDLCCTAEHQIVKQALQVATLLLEGGNKLAQQQFVDSIQNNHQGDRFFIAIRERIRRAMGEIKERKTFQKMKRDRMRAIAETRGRKQKVNIAQLSQRYEFLNEEFEETGFIQQIMRMLQQMCEGHNLKLQNLLRQQDFAVSVDLIHECLQYTLQLSKRIDHHNVAIAMQCFDSLTEFVQGPCLENQHVIGTAKFFFVTNEVLADTQLEKKLRLTDLLDLKYKIVLALISLTEGAQSHSICELMHKELKETTLSVHIERYGRQVARKEKTIDEIKRALDDEANNLELYTIEEASELRKNVNTVAEGVLARTGELGSQLYILLKILADSEKFSKHPRFVPLIEKYEANEKNMPRNHHPIPFPKQTGNIEIVRDNSIEQVYFTIPKVCEALTHTTRENFEEDVPRHSSQLKVQRLFEQTKSFRVEMEHYSASSAWAKIQQRWDDLKRVGFYFSILINFILLLFFKKTIDTVNGPIPIPGHTTMTTDILLTQTFTYDTVTYIMNTLGVIQLFLTVFLLLSYLSLSAPLKLKMQYLQSPQFRQDQTWNQIPKDRTFYLRCIRLLFTDTYFWFILIYLIVSLIALFFAPSVYCIHLFEVVIRVRILENVTRAVTKNAKSLLLTAVLLAVSLYFFSYIHFVWYYDIFSFGDPEGVIGNPRFCDSTLSCFGMTVSIGLRSNAFWDNVTNPNTHWTYFVCYMSFFIVNILILVNIVFGIILESFAEMRQKREENEELKRNRCFICDIEKSRFDARANEGITFEKHTTQEHNMWNYVFFLIYLSQKPCTEYTGTEQFIRELTDKDDTSFFPKLRSLVLEEAELRDRKENSKSSTTTPTVVGLTEPKAAHH